jgi:mRNA-degrading endonuclease RelE of RelBE toxin-antitoxin system
MSDIKIALKQPNIKWLAKHLNHIAENILFKKRNISFLAINALFRDKNFVLEKSKPPFAESFIIKGFVPVQTNDKLRTKADELSVVFYIDNQNNIIVITAYGESDEN